MLKTPLKFARVSSSFNPKRMHPVLHRVKGHFGTDFACPVGTPVWAAADGVITQRGPAGGAGNMITIRHDNGLVTLYMHLSKFIPTQKVGDRVAAKTVIAYSGNTGLSSGPHLHFGVKKNGVYVDFQSLKPTRAAGVSKGDLTRFRADTGTLVEQLAAIATASTARRGSRRARDDRGRRPGCDRALIATGPRPDRARRGPGRPIVGCRVVGLRAS
jgi:murein DD-endopeptidase MepM/ murein hydrolase activator NlpD